MADETLAAAAASAVSGEEVAVYKEPTASAAASTGSGEEGAVYKEPTVSASSGEEVVVGKEPTDSAPVGRELLLKEVQQLKDERFVIRRDLSNVLNRLAAVESMLPIFSIISQRTGRLENELHFALDNPSIAKSIAVERKKMENSVKSLEASFQVKIQDLSATIEVLEKELAASEKKAKEVAEKHAKNLVAREPELEAVVRATEDKNLKLVAENNELRSKVARKKLLKIQRVEDAKVRPMHSRKLRLKPAMVTFGAFLAMRIYASHLEEQRRRTSRS